MAATHARRAPARRARPGLDGSGRFHGFRLVWRLERWACGPRPRGGPRLEHRPRARPGADCADRGRRGDADGPRAARAAAAAHRRRVRVRRSDPRSGCGHAGRQRGDSPRRAVEHGVPERPRRRGRSAGVRSDAQAGAAGGRGHPRGVPADRRHRAAHRGLACQRDPRDGRRCDGHHAHAAHAGHYRDPQAGRSGPRACRA